MTIDPDRRVRFPVQQMLAAYGRLDLLTGVICVLPFAVLSWFLVERLAMKLKPRDLP